MPNPLNDKDPATAFRHRRRRRGRAGPSTANHNYSHHNHKPDLEDPFHMYAAPSASSRLLCGGADDDTYGGGDESSSYQPQLVRSYNDPGQPSSVPYRNNPPVDPRTTNKNGPTLNGRNESAATPPAPSSSTWPWGNLNKNSNHKTDSKLPQPNRHPRSSSSPNKDGTSSNSNREFQHATDFPSVTIRHVNVQQRSAFDVPSLVSLQEWQRIAALSRHPPRRLSPPYAHLERLHHWFHNTTTLRQIQFSSSTGWDADYFYSQKIIASRQGEADDDEKTLLPRRRRRLRDGRYRSLDPMQTAVAARMLGATTEDTAGKNSNHTTVIPPPILSHKKYRLPNRADVGFPNATLTEMEQKQQEIRYETAWEETSPRLIVWVTSDRLGTSVDGSFAASANHSYYNPSDNDTSSHSSATEEEKSKSISASAPVRTLSKTFYASYIGRDLKLAKLRNVQHFGPRNQQKEEVVAPIPPDLRPNPYSMLAPPLGSTFSPSQGWRPRPIHDRPAGMHYLCACPLEIHLPLELEHEPLMGSLTLYTLPPLYRDQPFRGAATAAAYHCSRQPGSCSTPAYGKISEAFWFPVASQNWRPKVDLPAVQHHPGSSGSNTINKIHTATTSGTVDPELLNSWVERQYKAIFAYDPLDLIMETAPSKKNRGSNNVDPASLFVVLQVYKLASRSSLTPMFGTSTPPRDKNPKWEQVYQQYGTQLRTPVAFGISKFFASSASNGSSSFVWPDGRCKEMQLYTPPERTESQEQFVERLFGIVYQRYASGWTNSPAIVLDDSNSAVSAHSNQMDADTVSMISDVSEPVNSAKKKGLKNRLFRSNKTSRPRTPVPRSAKTMSSSSGLLQHHQRSVSMGSLTSLSQHSTGTSPVSEALDGASAKLFLSSLSTDFLQAMLVTPRELEDMAKPSSQKKLPKLLVDISGDFAVLLDRTETTGPAELEARGDTVSKRSNLLRLPAPIEPAGYCGCSEFREILYLPARPERHYDVDSHFGSCRSVLNLLYLYPRLLRRSPENSAVFVDLHPLDPQTEFTVRIRLVHTTTGGVDEETQREVQRSAPVPCFHNVTPWVGPALLDAVYTQIPPSCTTMMPGYSTDNDIAAGIPMRDEIKVRLPDVLDGNYRVEFTLFSVEQPVHGGGMTLEHISEASVPLSSSSSSRDGGVSRVATVIPNGKHRLDLGGFQLHLETRLVSSIHVGDAAVAAALRDLPVSKSQIQASEFVPGLSNYSLASIDSRSLPLPALSPKLLASASESTVAGFFQVLLHVHLYDLLQSPSLSNDGATSDAPFSLVALMGSMQSLFEVIRKVKAKFHGRDTNESDKESIRMFLKRNMDTFDEAYLSERHQRPNQDEVDDDADAVADTKIVNASQDEEVENEHSAGEARDDFTVTKRGMLTISQRRLDSRSARIQAAMGPSGVPFSRVAYGATKTDRMRLEAELRHDGSHFMPFFDDDETIATAQSLHSSGAGLVKQGASTRSVPTTVRGRPNELKSSQRPASPTMLLQKQQQPAPDERHYAIGDTDFAKRVRVAAQVMLAPCVAPSLSAALSKCDPSPKEGNKNQRKATFFGHEVKEGTGALTGAMAWLCAPGSDTEDDGYSTRGHQPGSERKYLVTEQKYRGLMEAVTISFSVTGNAEDETAMGRGKYLYETIIVLWLRAWLDYVEKCFRMPPKRSGRQTATFDVSRPDPNGSQPEENMIFSFYAHMDVLLPLCLKSIIMRYGEDVLARHPQASKVILDDGHLERFEPFIEMLARGLLGQAFSGMSSPEGREGALRRAIESSEVVTDFLVGLFGVLHGEHMRVLVTKYFVTLIEAETEHLDDDCDGANFEWTEENLHRVRCSRQLRLRSIEKLAVVPFFLAVNYPLKYPGTVESAYGEKSTWLKQHCNVDTRVPLGTQDPVFEDGVEKLPRSGWLARLLITDCLSICATSCEAVVAEAIAHIESSGNSHGQTSKPRRPEAVLKRADLLMFQAMGIHSIEIVYELILRRHSMDRRFQTDSARCRIAGLLARPILEKSVESVRWLARMEATHKVRSIWLLSLAYIFQEAPDTMIREFVYYCCNPRAIRIHRFIRLLRLCTSSFQGFIDVHNRPSYCHEADMTMSPWLLQESFNTICATTNVVVEVCVGFMSGNPDEQRKTMRGILDLLLHLLTTPQSSVTHLRAVAGALQALEFDVDLFLEATGSSFQHWVRIILSLMNSVSLSVRSVAVDWVVSLLGNAYKLHGSIDALTLIFSSILPEIVAREIALYSISGNIASFDDIAKSVWPIRRSFADLQDTNPLDDDRVDPQLAAIISVFCRACQAVVDGVLLELRLQTGRVTIVGCEIQTNPPGNNTFDAEEESLFEAATFFVPEIAPMQRIRWLLTLKSLHETKEQWAEAAETLFLCARTICDALPHLKNVWRPSRFVLWSDSRHSLWLDTVGEDMGVPDRGNAEVMDFADHFLEPANFLGSVWKQSKDTDKLKQPTISAMCNLLAEVAKETVVLYLKEDGMDEIAYTRLESLLKVLMSVVEDHSASPIVRSSSRPMSFVVRKKQVEEEASLRKVSASISGDMTRLAERLLSIVENETGDFLLPTRPNRTVYVLLRLYGKKPQRFQESTTIPTFLEWDKPCICRVPKPLTEGPGGIFSMEKICLMFAQQYVVFLSQEVGKSNVILRTGHSINYNTNEEKTYVDVIPVEGTGNDPFQLSLASKRSKHFVHRQEPSTIVETTVAKEFPCALSRQTSLLTTEIMSNRTPSNRN